jgi:hypothetical protein
LLGAWAVSLVAIALVAVPALAGARPQPARAFYGANIQSMLTYDYVPESRWGQFIATMARDGLRTARMDAVWWWAEPTAPTAAGPTYVWNNPKQRVSMDHLVGLLAAHGVRLSAVLDQPPPWAQSADTQLLPSAYGDFAAFAGAFAARYGAHGSFWREHRKLPYLPVRDFEVWDEANSDLFWTGTSDPVAYASVLEQVSSAIHAVDPSGQVLASIGWEGAQQYVSALYAAGAGKYIDGIGFHPYAPDALGIIELNQELRATLDGAGAGATPIYDTEAGQPVVTAGPGAAFAYDGEVSDAARAATQALAGDALARSNCGVDDYLIFGLTGSGTALEPRSEGYMGIFSPSSDKPNATGTALIAAQQRLREDPSGRIALCGGTTPQRALLPLQVSLSRPGPTCVAARISYHGDPLEGADIVLRTRDGRVAPAATNAFGETQMCLQNGPFVKQFTADAEIPNVARSATYVCPVSAGACRRAR